MDGVVNGDPVPMAMPPVATSYHLSVPVHPDAVKLTVPGPHLEVPVPEGAAGTGFIVAITGVLELSHPELFVQET
jgi:hypothetical protein